MSQSLPEKAYLLDLSGSASIFEASKIHFEVEGDYKAINEEQKFMLEMMNSAYLPQQLGSISFEGIPFNLADQSVAFQGMCTEDYQQYSDFIKTLYGGEDVQVAETNRPFTLYLAINNKVTNNFSTLGTPHEYKSEDGKSTINGFYINSNAMPVNDPNGKFHIVALLCEEEKFVVFFLPKDKNFVINRFADFLKTSVSIIQADLSPRRESIGIDYPHIKELESLPDFSFMKDMNGFSKKFNEIVEVCEFKQKNKFSLNQYGAQFESTTSASIAPRSWAENRLTIDRSFFCVMYSHQGKPLNISYIPGHKFLKPV